MDTNLFVKIIRTVPAKNMKLIDLVNELVDSDGNLNPKQVNKRDAEINLARMEAAAYARATNKAVYTLMQVKPVTGGRL